MNNYKDLEVWGKSIEFVKSTSIMTKSFPSEEVYGLISQLQRASVSIPTKI